MKTRAAERELRSRMGIVRMDVDGTASFLREPKATALASPRCTFRPRDRRFSARERIPSPPRAARGRPEESYDVGVAFGNVRTGGTKGAYFTSARTGRGTKTDQIPKVVY